MPLRPQGPIEVVDRATLVLRSKLGDLLSVSVAVQVPIWLVLALVFRDEWSTGLAENQFWIWLTLSPDPLTFLVLAEEVGEAGTFGAILSRALPSIGLAVTGMACGILAHDWALGRATKGLDALGRVMRRLHVLVALWAIVHAIEIVTCLGIVLGPLVFGVAAPLCGMEGTGPWQGVVRSMKLSFRRFWWLCLSIPVASFVSALAAAIIGLATVPMLTQLTGGWIDVGGTAATALSAALPRMVLDPLLAMAMALIALDLKVQVEGYDLTVDLATGHGVTA